MATILGWKAQTITGLWIDRSELVDPSKKLKDVCAFEVQMDKGVIHVNVDPTKGETAVVFTRNIISVPGGQIAMPVFEIRQNPHEPERFVRLYLHPIQGPILSTEDLYG